MALDLLAFLCTGTNLGGSTVPVALGSDDLYSRVSRSDMAASGGYLTLSSAIAYPPADTSSGDGTGCVILFDSSPLPVPWFPILPDYQGRFLQLALRESAAGPLQVNNFAAQNFNNATTSALLLKTPRSENRVYTQFLGFRDLFLDEWNQQIDTMLDEAADNGGVDGIDRRGDPLLTWHPFPSASGLSSESIYIYIRQELDIRLKCWYDYRAWIAYWIYLYIDQDNKQLRGYVAKVDRWVEGGMYRNSILIGIDDAVLAGMDSLNDELREKLEETLASSLGEFGVTDYTLDRLYYLPGNQPDGPQAGILTGHTFGNVTIAVELGNVKIGGQAWPELARATLPASGDSVNVWLEAKRSQYSRTSLGKRIIDWYEQIKASRMHELILLDRPARQAAKRLGRRLQPVFAARGKLSKGDAADLALLMDKLAGVTDRKHLSTVRALRRLASECAGKGLPAIEQELAGAMKR